MKQEYNIFFLDEVSFEALNKRDKLKQNPQLTLCLDAKQERVQVKYEKCVLGYLSQNDSKEYIPYLKKGYENLYRSIIFQIKDYCDDPSKMIQIAIEITENKKTDTQTGEQGK